MNMTMTPLRKEKGSVLVLTALSLVVLMGVAALAIDLSHAYVNKTRLQNLADSLALSAAISLNKQESSTSIPDKEEYAENYAKTITLPTFKAADGNNEVTLGAASFTFTFATNWSATAGNWQAANAINGARFARVEVTTPMSIPTWFARIMSANFNNMAVSASAVAGATPIAPCDLAPFAMCAQPGTTDKNCQDNTNNPPGLPGNNDCYGYEINALYCMKNNSNTDPVLCPSPGSIGPGNFGFLDFGSTNPNVPNPQEKYCIAGDPNCSLNQNNCTLGGTIPVQPGQIFGQVSDGFNTRFNEYPSGNGGKLPSATYPPDMVIGNGLNHNANPDLNNGQPATIKVKGKNKPNPLFVNNVQTPGSETATNAAYTNYLNAGTAAPNAASIDLAAGVNGRRLLAIPFVDCSTLTNGSGNATIVGYGCFFMAREYGNVSVPYQYDKTTANTKYLYGEFTGDNACLGLGKTTSTSNFGFYKVILYKDPFSGHS